MSHKGVFRRISARLNLTNLEERLRVILEEYVPISKQDKETTHAPLTCPFFQGHS